MTNRKQLSVTDQEKIISAINGWDTEKLTWVLLCGKVKQLLKRSISRQALERKECIYTAYLERKKDLRSGIGKPVIGKTDTEQKLLDKIDRLEKDLAAAMKQNNEFYLQFRLWSKNAFDRKVTEQMLNQELPPVDKEPSKIPEKREKKNARASKTKTLLRLSKPL